MGSVGDKTPDVPGLVRYHIDSGGMERCNDGDFCIYSEVAALLAARDVVIEKIAELQKMAFRRAEAAEAELAQIKAQKPVGSLSDSNGVWWYAHGKTDGAIPLYAAPVDQTEGIHRRLKTPTLDDGEE